MADEQGRKLLKDLAKTVQEKVAPTGETKVHRRGLLTVELMARDLLGPDGMPGLQLWRDAPSKFRLQRPHKNAQIIVEWQRPISAMVVTCERYGELSKMTRYLYDEAADAFHRLEGVGELYEDIAVALVEYLYPEGRAT